MSRGFSITGNRFRFSLLASLLVVAGCLETNQPYRTTIPLSSSAAASTSIVPPSDSPEIETGIIRGIVTSDELVALGGASVRLIGIKAEVATADDGSFEFQGVPLGTQILEAQASGHVGQSRKVTVKEVEPVVVTFQLTPLPVDEAFIVVVHHTTLVHYGGGVYSYLVRESCSDGCRWLLPLNETPDYVIGEVTGRHAVPHPRGWDGLWLEVYRNDATGPRIWGCNWTFDTNAPCLRLPIRFAANETQLTKDPDKDGPLFQLQLNYACEPNWACLEERYESWVSLFYGYEKEEIPPGYSALPGG